MHTEACTQHQGKIDEPDNEAYKQVAANSMTSSSALLLPSVDVPDVNHEESEVLKSKLPLSNLASIDSVHARSKLYTTITRQNC